MALDYKKLQESLNKQLKEKGLDIDAKLVQPEDNARVVTREVEETTDTDDNSERS